MPLKVVLESLDGVDDAVKPLYAESGDKFVLQVEGIDSHPDVANLKSAYVRVKEDKANLATERDSLREKVASFPDDFDPEKWAKAKEGKADEAALIALRKELEAERDKEKARGDQAEAQLRTFALDRDLDDALQAAGVTEPAFMMASRKLLSDQIQINGEGKAFVETDLGPISIPEHVKRWAASDQGKPFVSKASGGGRGGNEGGGKGGGSGNALVDKVPALADLPES